ncbi:MAG: DUF3885 domain-containing protein [Eubacteriales bacterium]
MLKHIFEKELKDEYNIDEIVLIPTFYLFPNSIRFEIGTGEIFTGIFKNSKIDFLRSMRRVNPKYKVNAAKRAIVLLNSIDLTDNLLIVIDCMGDIQKISKYYEKSFNSHELKELAIYNDYPYTYNETIERLMYKCSKENIDFETLFESIVESDFVGLAFISKVFIFDLDKHIMVSFYDDRGMDVVAKNLESIRGLYEEHDDWILQYDKEEIDRKFNK